jgi:predicted Zn-dependent peptidase
MRDIEFKKIILKNNIRLILVPDSAKQVVTSMILFGVGSRYEEEKYAGISHVLEHMFYKGSQKRPTALDVSEFIENIGGEHNAFTSKEYTGYYTKVAYKHIEKAIDFLSDLVSNPLFPAEELEREKNVILQEVDMYEDLPMEVAASNLEKALFGDNALGRDVIGTKKSIQDVTREDLVNYRGKFYTGSNTVIVLAGNFNKMSEKEIVALVEKSFDVKEGDKSKFPAVKLTLKKASSVIEKPTEQSHLLVGFRGVSYEDTDRHKLRVLALILGGSMSSRMFTEIREKRGLAYSVHTSSSNYQDTGVLDTYAGVPHARVHEAIAAIINEYARVKLDVTENELMRAKEIIFGRMLIGSEDSSELASMYAMNELLMGKIMTIKQITEIYEKITIEDVMQVAKKYLIDERMALSFVGPKIDKEMLNKVFKI